MILNFSARPVSEFWLEQGVVSLSDSHQYRWLDFIDLSRSLKISAEERFKILEEFESQVFLKGIDVEYEFNSVLICTFVPWFIPDQINFWNSKYKSIYFPVGDALFKPLI